MPIIEAMSYGKPVVGFDVGRPKYTIEDGINGYSVKERDWEEMGGKNNCIALKQKFKTKD